MKFFAVLAVLVVAVAATDYSTWTLHQLSEAIQSADTNPAELPAMEQALNALMDALFAEETVVPVHVSAPVDMTGWTLHDLSLALQNPSTDPALIPYLEEALNEMMELIHAGIPVEAVGVPVKPLEVSYWTVQELSDALADPATSPALIPYLEHAVNEIMDALISGHQMEVIAVIAPAGLAPVKPEHVVNPVPLPIVEPNPEVTPPASTTSPLVQIIVNVQQ